MELLQVESHRVNAGSPSFYYLHCDTPQTWRTQKAAEAPVLETTQAAAKPNFREGTETTKTQTNRNEINHVFGEETDNAQDELDLITNEASFE